MVIRMDFRKHLSKYFGEDIVDLILEKNTLEIRQNAKELLEKTSIVPKKCKGCPIKNPEQKKMDFPAWLGDLNTIKTHKKEIMLIGISPNNLEYPVHIAYGLAYDYFSENDLNKLNPGARKFWERLQDLFNQKKDYLHNNIYITDMAFCDCKSKDKEILEFCSKERIMREIEFINPKLLIIHGFLIKRYINTFPNPTVFIPHVQGRGVLYYPADHQIWIETRDFIQKILNY